MAYHGIFLTGENGLPCLCLYGQFRKKHRQLGSQDFQSSSQADRRTRTRKTQKSSSSTTGTPPNLTPFSTVLCVELKQLLLSIKGVGVLPFPTPRGHCSHHMEDITGVDPAARLQRYTIRHINKHPDSAKER